MGEQTMGHEGQSRSHNQPEKPKSPRKRLFGFPQLAAEGIGRMPVNSTDFNLKLGNNPKTQERITKPEETQEEIAERLIREAEESIKRPKKSNWRKTLARLGTTVIILGGGIGAATVAKTIIENQSNPLATEAFNPNATEGVVGPNTILYIPREEFDKTPTVDENGDPLLDFPWDPNYPINRVYKLELSSSWAGWSRSGEVNIDTNAKNEWNESTKLPAGFEFPNIYPHAGTQVFFAATSFDKSIIDMAKLEFITPDGTFYHIGIGIMDDSGGTKKLLPITPLIDAPIIGADNNQGKDLEKGAFPDADQKIFKTTKEGKLYMYMEGRKNGSLLFKDSKPGDFKFKMETDATGAPKILVPEIE